MVKKQKDCRWSSTLKCWHIACYRSAYAALTVDLHEKAEIQTAALKTYLQQRKVLVPATQNTIVQAKAKMMLLHHINEENLEALTAY